MMRDEGNEGLEEGKFLVSGDLGWMDKQLAGDDDS